MNEAVTCNNRGGCVHDSVIPNSCFWPAEISVPYFNDTNKINAMSHIKQFEK